VTPGTFEYHRPASVAEAVGLLVRHGEAARVLAGGHSLVPMMKLRLATPEHLVDINGIGELKGISRESGEIRIGAAATQAEAAASDVLAAACPIIAEAIAVIADPQVRNCGTIGGNAANGDPGNDLPTVMMALDARYALRGADGEREVAARDYYLGVFDTAIAPGEILSEIRISLPAAGHGYAYRKLKRKVGDYATAATAVIVEMAGGNCAKAAVALTNVGPTAIHAAEAADALAGTALDDDAIEQAAARAMAVADPVGDLHGPADYRRAMVGEMTRRAIRDSRSRASGG
jgi:carbon-monoxide dehydrogenase medium subunit